MKSSAVFLVAMSCSLAASGCSQSSVTLPQAHLSGTASASHGVGSSSYRLLRVFGIDKDDGFALQAGLIRFDGYFYGTAAGGGAHDRGVVYRLGTAGSESVLHAFGATPGDGLVPNGSLTELDGTLYGTTAAEARVAKRTITTHRAGPCSPSPPTAPNVWCTASKATTAAALADDWPRSTGFYTERRKAAASTGERISTIAAEPYFALPKTEPKASCIASEKRPATVAARSISSHTRAACSGLLTAGAGRCSAWRRTAAIFACCATSAA
ncbi:MAG: hypothetical protein JO199_14470 [Candidatus Eremiobacteraeota bacterium]|nr:hypothetical protein [Candidatus Eremiobacteraeota bacterium]